jgi:cytochrome c biogenesis protein CcdA
MVLLVSFGLGMGLPFILAAYGVDLVSRRLKEHPQWARRCEILAAALLGLFGWMLFKNRIRWLLRFLPRETSI